MSGKKLRNGLRWVHLLGAALIGTFVYSPWREGWFLLLIQVVVIPLLSLSGVWMWKQAWMSKRLGVRVVQARGGD